MQEVNIIFFKDSKRVEDISLIDSDIKDLLKSTKTYYIGENLLGVLTIKREDINISKNYMPSDFDYLVIENL